MRGRSHLHRDLEGEGKRRDGIVGQPTSVSVLIPVIQPPNRKQDVEIDITVGGANAGADVAIDRDPDGTYVGTYIPETIGFDSVYVRADAMPIPASPLTCGCGAPASAPSPSTGPCNPASGTPHPRSRSSLMMLPPERCTS